MTGNGDVGGKITNNSVGDDTEVKKLIESMSEVQAPADLKVGASVTTADTTGEIERYWVNEPFAYISIVHDADKMENVYIVHEPELTDFEAELLELLYDNLRDMLIKSEVDTIGGDRQAFLREKCGSLLSIYGIKLDKESHDRILYYLSRNYLGYGIIDPLMRDESLEDISCNGVNIPIFLFHRKYQNIRTNLQIPKEEDLNSMVMKLVQRGGKHISISSPIASATLPDGSRIEATLGREITSRGSSFSIRKFRPDPFTPVDLISYNTMSTEILAYLWLAIENNKSLLFAGGTASGKTSSLNAVSLFIPQSSKVITIEDTRELMLYHNNWIAGVTREMPVKQAIGDIEMFDLLRAALRQRPEYIIVGEVRGKEALTLFQAMNTGHTTYSTMHAGSIQAVVNRLLNDPINVPNMMLQSLNIVSVQEMVYLQDRRVRRTKSIVEITGVDPRTNNVRISELYKWNSQKDTFDRLADSYVLGELMEKFGWNGDQINEEINRRSKVLKYMESENIRDYRNVSIVIHAYQVMPVKVLEMIDRNELKSLLPDMV
jgi:archaeal flagellar protein FlaI